MRVSKRFRVMDRADLELLAETFNLANHINQTGVGSTTAYNLSGNNLNTNSPAGLSTGTFGTFNPQTFTGSGNNNLLYTPRQVQFGARVQF